jgi:hypothetical protein
MYFASQDKSAIITCYFELQAMMPLPHLIRMPKTLLHPLDIAQSESANTLKMG